MTDAMAAADRTSTLLEAAARRAAANWESFREDAVSETEAEAVAAELGRELLSRMDGGRAPDQKPPVNALSRKLLVRMRRELIELMAATSPMPSSAEMLRCFGAIESLASDLEPDWRERFTDRLSGPNGLELVVELAHDLRSPLTSILFLAETLQRGRSGPVTPLQERQLGLIYSAAFGLSSVSSDVIELARGAERLVDLEPIPFAVADIFESVRDIVQPIAEEKALEIRIAPTRRSARIGHPVALSRVLLNLTTNALKFTDTGYVGVQATEQDGGAVEFAVQDTGRGIPPEALSMLFEPFRRRERNREYAFSGSGLGLSICRKLVEAMGGELTVETGVGRGTRFAFTLHLPLAESDPAFGSAD